MADNKPTPQDRKARFFAPLTIAAVVAAVLLVIVARQPSPPPPPAPAPVKPAAPPIEAVKLAPQPPLTRAELIEHARAIGATYAATGGLPAQADPYVGRRFSLRIAFACNGILGSSAGAQATVSYDTEKQSVTLVARPGDWTSLPLVQTLADSSELEAVEGFWLPRSWMTGDGCPAAANYIAPATPTPPTAPTIGMAEIFGARSSRIVRHAERPYEFTRKVPAESTDLLTRSYRLVLEGSISGFSRRQAMQCWMESPDHQPLCVYGVTLDHVAFVDGSTGEVLANWTD